MGQVKGVGCSAAESILGCGNVVNGKPQPSHTLKHRLLSKTSLPAGLLQLSAQICCESQQGPRSPRTRLRVQPGLLALGPWLSVEDGHTFHTSSPAGRVKCQLKCLGCGF